MDYDTSRPSDYYSRAAEDSNRMLSTRIHCHCRYLYHILENMNSNSDSNTTSSFVSGEDEDENSETRPSLNEGETTRGSHKSRLYVCESFFE
jgi:hypothetical protein